MFIFNRESYEVIGFASSLGDAKLLMEKDLGRCTLIDSRHLGHRIIFPYLRVRPTWKLTLCVLRLNF